MSKDSGSTSSSTHLSIIKMSKAANTSCEKRPSAAKKKRAFEGFSEEDVATTKKVQQLYHEKFSMKRIPQDEVASQVGWSQSTLNLYINAKQRIGDTALRKFCNLFDVSPDVLSSNYRLKNSEKSPSGTNDLSEMKAILSELIEAVDGKRDLNLIVMKAKNIVNE